MVKSQIAATSEGCLAMTFLILPLHPLQRGTVKGENTAVIARSEVTKQSLLNEIATGYALAMTQREGWKN